jgi:hypothetical protein
MTTEGSEEGESKSTNPMVFISHDTRDADLAEAFSHLLKSVSAGVLKSFRTSDRRGNQGIEYGIEWYPEIIKNIQSASDVVCLLTKRSVDRPWILFEAGMATGKLDTPILGVALGIELKAASSGPFAQFQNCGDDEDSLTKLVFQLVNRIPNSEPDRDTIKFQVGKFRSAIAPILEKLGEAAEETNSTQPNQDVRAIENSSAKLFEEIKIMFQDLPSRIERSTPSEKRMRKRRFHPGMIDELMHSFKDPKIALYVALSFYREKMPWVYDAGLTIVNKLDTAQMASNPEKYLSELESLLKFSSRSSFIDVFIDDENEFMLFQELPHMILRHVHRLAL